MGASGLFSGNKINTDVSAYIDEGITYDYTSEQGSRSITSGDQVEFNDVIYEYTGVDADLFLSDSAQNYTGTGTNPWSVVSSAIDFFDFSSDQGDFSLTQGDRVLHDGVVYQYEGVDAEIQLSNTAQNYAGSASWTALVSNNTPTTINATGDVNITASDESAIYANSKVVSSSITTTDGGAADANNLVGYLLNVEYTSDGTNVVADSVEYGERIRLTTAYTESGTGKGSAGSVYEYLGSGTAISPDMLVLGDEDFTNLDFWKEVPETQLVPEGNNFGKSNSASAAGMVVLNDVRGEVQSWIDQG
jgi:hypothetical protein